MAEPVYSIPLGQLVVYSGANYCIKVISYKTSTEKVICISKDPCVIDNANSSLEALSGTVGESCTKTEIWSTEQLSPLCVDLSSEECMCMAE